MLQCINGKADDFLPFEITCFLFIFVSVLVLRKKIKISLLKIRIVSQTLKNQTGKA